MKRLLTIAAALMLGGTAMAQTHRVVDVLDVRASPARYVGTPIELRRLSCYFADEEDYRCVTGDGVAVFFTEMGPGQIEALRRNCSEIRRITSAACTRTLRFTPTEYTSDLMDNYRHRIVLHANHVDVIAQAQPQRNQRRR